MPVLFLLPYLSENILCGSASKIKFIIKTMCGNDEFLFGFKINDVKILFAKITVYNKKTFTLETM